MPNLVKVEDLGTKMFVISAAQLGYGIDPEGTEIYVPAGHAAINSQNFVAVQANGSGERKLALKRHSYIPDPDDAKKVLMLMEFCAKSGALVPHPVRTEKGEMIYSEEGDMWSAFEFIDGDSYNGHEGQLAFFGEALAQLHKIMKLYPGRDEIAARVDPDRRKYGRHTWTQETLDRIWEGLQQSKKEGGDAQIDAVAEMHFPWIRDMVQAYRPDDFLPEQVIHGEPTAKNNIFSSERICPYFIGFSDTRVAPIEDDLAFAAVRFAVHGNDGTSVGFAKRARLFVQSYESRMGNSIPLANLNKMPMLFLNSVLLRIFKQLSLQYLDRNNPWARDFGVQLAYADYVDRLADALGVPGIGIR